MPGPLVALWNFQPRPSHVLVVLQSRRLFFVRELPPRTALHLEARLLGDARVFFATSEAEARALACNVAGGFEEGSPPLEGPGGPPAAPDGTGRGKRRRRSTWLGSRRRSR
jgi:hypothetical protein